MAAAKETISTFLEQQHDELAKTFAALDKLADPGNTQGRRHLFEYLKEQLEAHLAVTEQLLFPRLAQAPAVQDVIDEATAAHDVMRGLLEELDQYVNDLEVWQAGCRRLQQVFAQDAEQERQQLYPQCDRLPADEQNSLLHQAHVMALASRQ
jgi:iron-sulfur cluster repair protein YtfE (RIC family)